MADERNVVVVCGYGCHLKDPCGKDTPLKSYLDRVVDFLGETLPWMVIYCGGYTQRATAPGKSEAWVMLEYVGRNYGRFKALTYDENGSYTTYWNIRNAATIVRNSLFHYARGEKVCITIFCEATRAPNVVMLARHFMGDLVESIDDITVETASWERADPFKQVKNLIYNKLAIKYPWLGLAEREHRKRIKRAKEI